MAVMHPVGEFPDLRLARNDVAMPHAAYVA